MNGSFSMVMGQLEGIVDALEDCSVDLTGRSGEDVEDFIRLAGDACSRIGNAVANCLVAEGFSVRKDRVKEKVGAR